MRIRIAAIAALIAAGCSSSAEKSETRAGGAAKPMASRAYDRQNIAFDAKAPARIAGSARPHPEALRLADPAPNDEVYTPTETRIVKRPAETPLSTFSVDVDTASYTIARRKLREGQPLPKDAVRVEEFLNYFDYGDRPPRKAAFSVTTELASSPYDAGKSFLRIGLRGKDVSVAERKPVHLTFLIDVSGSMAQTGKLDLVKRSLRILLANLKETDTVALCTYAGRVAKILDPTPAFKRGLIDEAIGELSAGGSTGMASGIDLAYRLAEYNLRPSSVNRVIVCSDGDANVGPTSSEAILELIARQRKRGITLSTIGFGVGNYKDVIMERLADKGNGNYYYIDNLSQARRVFQDEVSGTLQIIAADVKVQVEFDPAAVKTYRLVGYENRDIADEDFRRDEVDAGEIGAGHRVTALYELELHPGARRLGALRLRYKEPGESKAREIESALDAPLLAFYDASPAYRFCVGVAGFAELLRRSPHAAEWTYGQVEEAVRSGAIPKAADRREVLELIDRARGRQRP